jgi:hypothetical protein
MHDVPRKDREDADDVDEDEVSEISGGFADPDRINIPIIPGYPQYPGGIPEPGLPDDPICPDPYIE